MLVARSQHLNISTCQMPHFSMLHFTDNSELWRMIAAKVHWRMLASQSQCISGTTVTNSRSGASRLRARNYCHAAAAHSSGHNARSFIPRCSSDRDLTGGIVSSIFKSRTCRSARCNHTHTSYYNTHFISSEHNYCILIWINLCVTRLASTPARSPQRRV